MCCTNGWLAIRGVMRLVQFSILELTFDDTGHPLDFCSVPDPPISPVITLSCPSGDVSLDVIRLVLVPVWFWHLHTTVLRIIFLLFLYAPELDGHIFGRRIPFTCALDLSRKELQPIDRLCHTPTKYCSITKCKFWYFNMTRGG